MKKAIKIYIKGIVQGVFFRSFIKESAEKLDLKGFVRNLEDGRVEVVVEGEIDKLKNFVEICKKGSTGSQVKDVEVVDEKIQDFKNFKISYI